MNQRLREWIAMSTEERERTDLGDSIVDTTELIAQHERLIFSSHFFLTTTPV